MMKMAASVQSADVGWQDENKIRNIWDSTAVDKVASLNGQMCVSLMIPYRVSSRV